MIRTRTAGTKSILVGLVIAAIAAGSAAAVAPISVVPLQARLAPVAGTTSAPGRFSGVLARSAVPVQGTQGAPAPRNPTRWRLSWKASLPQLGNPAAMTLQVAARGGAATVAKVLCSSCSASAKGAMTLTNNQATSILNGDAVVMVRAPSATLRGVVRIKHSSGMPPG